VSSAFDVDPMVEDVRRLVEVESPSRDVAALEQSAVMVANLLERLTGRAPELVAGADGPHVHWRGGGTPRVLVLGHHDTVFPMGTLAARPFTVAGERATGPGVFDMKAGIVLAAYALAALEDRSGVEVVVTADEEVGSTTSRALIEERALACGAVLVLEPAADGGALKTGRKGVGTFELVVTGRAAHAGLEPELGANALVEAARQVLAVAEVAAPGAGTTVTPTLASAGTAENVVPAMARVTVDVRVSTLDEARRIDAAFGAIAAVDPATTVEVRGGVNRPPMDPAAGADLFARAADVAAGLGLGPVDGVTVGGGSDGNFTAAIGVPTLDGLGAVGGGAHADHEWIDVAALPARAALLAGLLRSLTT
jgi:glutamate carboxypeptidase